MTNTISSNPTAVLPRWVFDEAGVRGSLVYVLSQFFEELEDVATALDLDLDDVETQLAILRRIGALTDFGTLQISPPRR